MSTNVAVRPSLLLALALSLVGCYGESAAPTKSPEQVQAEQLVEKQRLDAHKIQSATVAAELQKATQAEIRAIYRSCKSSVLALAKSRNTTPYEVFLVDEYSADIYQTMAYGTNVLSDEQNAKRFLKSRRSSKYLEVDLNLTYSVIFARDGFSGPTKESKAYMCFVKPGLVAEAL